MFQPLFLGRTLLKESERALEALKPLTREQLLLDAKKAFPDALLDEDRSGEILIRTNLYAVGDNIYSFNDELIEDPDMENEEHQGDPGNNEEYEDDNPEEDDPEKRRLIFGDIIIQNNGEAIVAEQARIARLLQDIADMGMADQVAIVPNPEIQPIP